MTPEPATAPSSTKKMWLLVIALAVVALGLNLFAYIRKPGPWQEAARGPLILAGLLLMAWAGLLPATKTGAQRALRVLSLACVVAGAVLVLLDIFGS
jgi:peptidoglycan/LPS O-acetylase OafA/YrhL